MELVAREHGAQPPQLGRAGLVPARHSTPQSTPASPTMGPAGRVLLGPDCETPTQLTASTTSTRARPLHNTLSRLPGLRAQDPAVASAARVQPSRDPATRTGPGADFTRSTTPYRQPGAHGPRPPPLARTLSHPRTCHHQAPADTRAARTLPRLGHSDRTGSGQQHRPA